MTDTSENRIDVTRPLELSDGTPVTFVRIDRDGDILVKYPDGSGGFYLPDTGQRYGPPYAPRLRNVAEARAVASKPAFDPTKPVQTRDGRMARIVCTDKAGQCPIVALVANADGIEDTVSFMASGLIASIVPWHPGDLINVPERIERIERYRKFRFRGRDLALDSYSFSTEEGARFRTADWDGVIKTITEDGKLISIEVVREDEA